MFVRNPWVGDLTVAKTPMQYITPLHERMQRTLGMLPQCLHNTVIGMNVARGSHKDLSRLPSGFKWVKITRSAFSNTRHNGIAPSG